jgi:UDP-N-acetylglucosamine 2-epimerase (non-hydrolysing)
MLVVGTRPNFIKVTRFKEVNAAMGHPFDIQITHTGQHHNDAMAGVFFRQFGLEPDHFLEVPPSSPNTQMAETMIRLEKNLLETDPGLVLVTGDVNSTFAAAFTAYKCGYPVAHIESGLRSFDRSMPEEINRVLTDEISDLFFVTEQSGIDNLLNEGKHSSQIQFVGNTMIDTLVRFDSEIRSNPIPDVLGVKPKEFALMTMHRPATVDLEEGLKRLAELLEALTAKINVVFPIHPRTLKNIERFGLLERFEQIHGLHRTPPLDYFAFQRLLLDSVFVISDSGGLQEESTFRQIPCLTLRPNTERPSTITMGSNELVESDPAIVMRKVEDILSGRFKQGKVPPYWDGKSTERILEVLKGLL